MKFCIVVYIYLQVNIHKNQIEILMNTHNIISL